MADLLGSRLEQLEWHWRRIGAPVAERLNPGLSDDEMDELTAPLGVRLPAELREWFGWHDGAGPPEYLAGCFVRFVPLRTAVEDTQLWNEIGAEMGHVNRFGDDWIMALKNGVSCSCSNARSAPVYSSQPSFAERGEPVKEPTLPSFAALLDWWIEHFEADAFEVPPDTDMLAKPGCIPQERLLLHMV